VTIFSMRAVIAGSPRSSAAAALHMLESLADREKSIIAKPNIPPAAGPAAAGCAANIQQAPAMSSSKQEDHVPVPAEDPELLDFASKIFNLARAGDEQALAAYVDAGVPADLTNDKGDSLLMLAAYHGHADAVRLLLQRGVDPGRANDRGRTPPAGAALKREPEVVRALLDGGADPDAGTPSAADTAAMFGNEEFLAWFAAARRT
jgi:ankyrin repeat protein